jgi:hypothetical protein
MCRRSCKEKCWSRGQWIVILELREKERIKNENISAKWNLRSRGQSLKLKVDLELVRRVESENLIQMSSKDWQRPCSFL